MPPMSGMSVAAHGKVLPEMRSAVSVRLDPWIEIVEQPKSSGIRFPHKREKQPADSISGENSSADFLTFPTIKVSG